MPRPCSSTGDGPGEVALPQVGEAEREEGMGEAEGLIATLAERNRFLGPRRRLPELADLGEGASEKTARVHG